MPRCLRDCSGSKNYSLDILKLFSMARLSTTLTTHTCRCVFRALPCGGKAIFSLGKSAITLRVSSTSKSAIKYDVKRSMEYLSAKIQKKNREF